MLLNNRT